jgi:hypothetical protein
MQAKAEVLASQAHTWHRGRSKQDGTPFFIIPGTEPGSAHWTNVHGCTCAGNRRRGVCTHQIACQILQRQQDAAIVVMVQEADAERQKRYEALFGDAEPPATVRIARPCAVRGCPIEAGTDSALCSMHAREQRATVAA